MKITKRQLRRIIKEEIATVNDDAIEDAVMGVLSDEGGAAGLDPIEDALEDLEDDDISLPDEDIEDIIGGVVGVKRHADGDYVDTTQLEGKSMKLTKQQLKRIIKEEKAKLQEARYPLGHTAMMDALDEFVDSLDEQMGYGVPNATLKAEVLKLVDEYFAKHEALEQEALG